MVNRVAGKAAHWDVGQRRACEGRSRERGRLNNLPAQEVRPHRLAKVGRKALRCGLWRCVCRGRRSWLTWIHAASAAAALLVELYTPDRRESLAAPSPTISGTPCATGSSHSRVALVVRRGAGQQAGASRAGAPRRSRAFDAQWPTRRRLENLRGAQVRAHPRRSTSGIDGKTECVAARGFSGSDSTPTPGQFHRHRGGSLQAGPCLSIVLGGQKSGEDRPARGWGGDDATRGSHDQLLHTAATRMSCSTSGLKRIVKTRASFMCRRLG